MKKKMAAKWPKKVSQKHYKKNSRISDNFMWDKLLGADISRHATGYHKRYENYFILNFLLFV